MGHEVSRSVEQLTHRSSNYIISCLQVVQQSRAGHSCRLLAYVMPCLRARFDCKRPFTNHAVYYSATKASGLDFTLQQDG